MMFNISNEPTITNTKEYFIEWCKNQHYVQDYSFMIGFIFCFVYVGIIYLLKDKMKNQLREDMIKLTFYMFLMTAIWFILVKFKVI